MFNGAECVTSAEIKVLHQWEERETHFTLQWPHGKESKATDAVSLITELWLFCTLQKWTWDWYLHKSPGRAEQRRSDWLPC